MEKKENTLNGFEAIFDSLSFNTEANEDTQIDLNDVAEELTDEELEELKNGDSKKNKTKTKVEDVEDNEDDEVEEDDDSKSKKSTKTTKKEKEDIVEETTDEEDNDDKSADIEDQDESKMVTGFFDALSEQLGWEDLEDEDKPKTAEELISYFEEVIKEESVPTYASDEVQKLDEFVKNGGNIREYFEIDKDVDWESLEIEDNEENQKLVLKEFLKEKNYSEKSIEKKLSKYDEAGILEDEAMDAQEQLIQIKADKKEQLLIQQQKLADDARLQQQKFFDSVVNEIKGLDNIYGVKIPEKDKKVLLEYIFKPDTDGYTKYRKDFDKSRKNLIASAYFMMKGDNLIDLAKKEGKKDALNNFKDSLTKNNGINKRSKKQTINNDDSNSIWESFTRNFRAQ